MICFPYKLAGFWYPNGVNSSTVWTLNMQDDTMIVPATNVVVV